MVQKCQVSLGTLGEAESKATEWEAEIEGLQAASDAKDEQLREEVPKNAGLVADLKKALAKVENLEEDMHTQRRPAVDLVTERNKERATFEATMEEKKDELEYALTK